MPREAGCRTLQAMQWSLKAVSGATLFHPFGRRAAAAGRCPSHEILLDLGSITIKNGT
jgi:hypothetical protein